jgi:hypothetical protein
LLVLSLFSFSFLACGDIQYPGAKQENKSKRTNPQFSAGESDSVKADESAFSLTLPEVEDQAETTVALPPPVDSGPYKISGRCDSAESPLRKGFWVMQVSLFEEALLHTHNANQAADAGTDYIVPIVDAGLVARGSVALPIGCKKASLSISGLKTSSQYEVIATMMKAPGLIEWSQDVVSIQASAVLKGKTGFFRPGSKVVLPMVKVQPSSTDQEIEVIFLDLEVPNDCKLQKQFPVCGQPKQICPPGRYCAAVISAPVTYANYCELKKAGARLLYGGPCKTEINPPIGI